MQVRGLMSVDREYLRAMRLLPFAAATAIPSPGAATLLRTITFAD